jgi:hypothetical protein
MPHENDLPGDLRPLSIRQALDLRDAHFHADAERLIDTLNQTVPRTVNRLWRLKSTRFAVTVSAALALGAIMGGVLLLRVNPASPGNPASASPRRIAPGKAPVPSPRSNRFEADTSKQQTTGPSAEGKWKATVKYWDEATYPETFNFEVIGAELSGTASFLGADHNIFDGKIVGDRISFVTKSLTALGDETHEDKQYYKGTVKGDTIRFSMVIDSNISQEPLTISRRRGPR